MKAKEPVHITVYDGRNINPIYDKTITLMVYNIDTGEPYIKMPKGTGGFEGWRQIVKKDNGIWTVLSKPMIVSAVQADSLVRRVVQIHRNATPRPNVNYKDLQELREFIALQESDAGNEQVDTSLHSEFLLVLAGIIESHNDEIQLLKTEIESLKYDLEHEINAIRDNMR